MIVLYSQLDCILPSGHYFLFCFVTFPLLSLKAILGVDLMSIGGRLHAALSSVNLLVVQIGHELLVGLQFSFPLAILHSISLSFFLFID